MAGSDREDPLSLANYVSLRRARLARRAVFRRAVPLAVGWLLFIHGSMQGQISPGLSESDSTVSHAPPASASLPKTAEEIDQAVAQLDRRLDAVRASSGTVKTLDNAASMERSDLLQQWMLAMDQQSRHLRSLKEIRRLNSEHLSEQEQWQGFAQPPTIATAEQLMDAVSSQRLELRTVERICAILDGEILRFVEQLNESRKQLRVAEETTTRGNHSQQEWLLPQAQLRTRVHEASVEAGQVGRLVLGEAIVGRRKYLQFLEEKLASARVRYRVRKTDIEAVLAQIDEKRVSLQKDLVNAIAVDRELRASRDRAAIPAERSMLLLALDVENARVETSTRKIESLRSFLRLTEEARRIWEDRLWTTGERGLRELCMKRRHYDQLLDQLRDWKTLMEQSLSVVSEQVLRAALRAENIQLNIAESDVAKQIHATLQERAWIELRTVAALAFTEDLMMRLQTELAEQIARISLVGRLHAVFQDLGAFLESIWHAELYIAEDNVIVGGQKVSIPRAITLGKVVIALTIFLAGLFVARCTFRFVNRIASSGPRANQPSGHAPAKLGAVIVAISSLLIAMASVRIPWTVFAFLGGALAIGVGFGAQTLINNFISGVILLCERSIRVGDIVEVDDQRGKIVSVGFRNSLVLRGDGTEVLVPNSQFLEKKVVNWTLTNDLVRSSISVGVAYDSPSDQVAQLISQALAEHQDIVKKPQADVLLEEFAENALLFKAQFWLRLCPGVDGGTVRSQLRHRIKILFHQAGVKMAFSQRDIHVNANRLLEIRVVNEPQHLSAVGENNLVGRERELATDNCRLSIKR